MLVGFELRDREQVAQMIEVMPTGEPDQMGERFGDEACGLVGAAVAGNLDGHCPPSL